MSSDSRESRFYWTRHTTGDGRWIRAGDGNGMPPGADLAKLRRGLGREPGDVPEMWRFYTTLNREGNKTAWLAGEHDALALFALHQQSQSRPMHRAGVGLGTAVRALRNFNGDGAQKQSNDRGTPKQDRIEAVDRRFAAAATASSRSELVLHLRGLITQLRGVGQGLDYTALHKDLANWEKPEEASKIRRRWGSQYFVDRTISKPSASSAEEDQK
ncbi:type I-E CRISPR-associated protein Cse2/CasB [Actinoplanes siamensis]|uniref:CRISPR system Cascade subunit CasB n=1 Tax=Actinoplanes siamensis TaxID=1223317 RepID=A0A919N4Z8_9ACTN|nr:type I-E CRISPR-associated protein Cse2/CasB [Actinoplanes siamensis]GIF04424.1 hypothetical protein Asi03nite_19620 [Actinoplanes siamensis]